MKLRLDVQEPERIAVETHAEIDTSGKRTRDRGATLVRTVPSLSLLAQHSRLNCLAPSGPAPLKERVTTSLLFLYRIRARSE